jgi:hypothetical protein
MSQKEAQGESNISITVPLDSINKMVYSNAFVEETAPIYGKDILQAKAIIGGKNITLLRFRPKLTLENVKIENVKIKENKGRPKLSAEAWFYFSPSDDKNNHDDESYPDDHLGKARKIEVEADLDIYIDQNNGKIQINPKYAVLEAKISNGSGRENEPEPFCRLSIPLQLEKLKVELPLGVSKFNVPFQAPINKTFVNSGTEFPIQGTMDKNMNIEFKYRIDLEEEQQK